MTNARLTRDKKPILANAGSRGISFSLCRAPFAPLVGRRPAEYATVHPNEMLALQTMFCSDRDARLLTFCPLCRRNGNHHGGTRLDELKRRSYRVTPGARTCLHRSAC